MNSMKWLWVGILVLTAWTVVAFFLGRSLYGNSNYDPSYFAGIASAGLGGALSLIVVLITFRIARENREKDLNQVRFAFLRKQGEMLWQTYIAFCQSLGVNCGPIDQATWNTTNKKLWPSEIGADELHQRIKAKVISITSPPGSQTVHLMDAYDDVFAGATNTVAFEGELTLAIELIEGTRQFGWACSKIQDYQDKIGWTIGNWPDISESIQQTSSAISQALTTLVRLSTKVRLIKR